VPAGALSTKSVFGSTVKVPVQVDEVPEATQVMALVGSRKP
jgi:hypothetical protein